MTRLSTALSQSSLAAHLMSHLFRAIFHLALRTIQSSCKSLQIFTGFSRDGYSRHGLWGMFSHFSKVIAAVKSTLLPSNKRFLADHLQNQLIVFSQAQLRSQTSKLDRPSPQPLPIAQCRFFRLYHCLSDASCIGENNGYAFMSNSSSSESRVVPAIP